MRILVDADACPGPVKDILYRAAERTRLTLVLFANRPLRTPASAYISAVQVARGFDVADDEIARRVEPGDLVVTADIPLAAQVLEKGAHALDPRGVLFSTETIREKLTLRDFMDQMRASGVATDGPPPFVASDRQRFAAQLDRLLAHMAGT